MKTRSVLSLVAALTSFSGVLPCQVPWTAPTGAQAVAPPRDQGVGVGTWAALDSCKCGYVDGAFTVVPWLGEQAPQSLPWRWRTVQASVGEHDLRGAAPWREQHDDGRFAASAGLVTERWTLRADGIEQSFVVAARPAPGDLVVRGAVDGELHAEPRSARVAPLVFRAADGTAELRYGEALAIDAAGRRWPVATAFDGTAIELRVPAETVGEAMFPLLIDPLLTVYVFESGTVVQGNGVTETDVAHVDASDRMSLVRTEVRWASNSDSDLLVWKCRDDFVVWQLVHSDLDPTKYAHGGTVAAVGNNASYVVAWARGTIASTGVHWFTLPADSYGPPTVRTLVRPSGTSERAPRIAGRRGQVAGAPAHALLVRLRETSAGYDRTELWGSVIDTGVDDLVATFQLAHGGTAGVPVDNDQPWVGRESAGTSNEWPVVWQTFSPATGLWSVRARRVLHDGTLGAETAPPVPAGHHAMQPRVDGTAGRHLLVYATASGSAYPGKLTTYGGTNVRAQRFHWAGATAVYEHGATILAASFARDLAIAGIAHDPTTLSHWAVAHGPQGAAPTLQVLGYRGRVVRSAQLPGPGTGTVSWRSPALAFDHDLGHFVVHYATRSVDAGVTSWHLYGGRQEHPALSPTPWFGPFCVASAGSIGMRPFLIGAEFASIGLHTPDPNELALLALSTHEISTPLSALGFSGGCELLADISAGSWLGILTAVTDASGDARLYFPLPENLTAMDLVAQWFRFRPNGDVAASRGAHVEVR